MGLDSKSNYFCTFCGIRDGWYPKNGAPNIHNGLSVDMGKGAPKCPVHHTRLRDRR